MTVITNNIYGVYYYYRQVNHTRVYLAGLYVNKDHAIERIKEFIPNHTQLMNNAIGNNYIVGWVSEHKMGDHEYNGLSCEQPDNAIFID